MGFGSTVKSVPSLMCTVMNIQLQGCVGRASQCLQAQFVGQNLVLCKVPMCPATQPISTPIAEADMDV